MYFPLWQRNQVHPYTTLRVLQQKNFQFFVKIDFTSCIFTCFFHTVVARQCQMYMYMYMYMYMPVTTCRNSSFSYHCHDSNTDDKDSHIIATYHPALIHVHVYDKPSSFSSFCWRIINCPTCNFYSSFIRIILNILQLRDKNIVLDIVLVYKYIKFNCNFFIPTMDGKNTTYIV